MDLSRKAPKLRLPNIFVLEEIKTTASHYLQNLKIMRCLIYSQKKEKKNSKLYKFSLSSTPKCWDLHIWCAKFIPDEVSAFRPAFLTSVHILYINDSKGESLRNTQNSSRWKIEFREDIRTSENGRKCHRASKMLNETRAVSTFSSYSRPCNSRGFAAQNTDISHSLTKGSLLVV